MSTLWISYEEIDYKLRINLYEITPLSQISLFGEREKRETFCVKYKNNKYINIINLSVLVERAYIHNSFIQEYKQHLHTESTYCTHAKHIVRT